MDLNRSLYIPPLSETPERIRGTAQSFLLTAQTYYAPQGRYAEVAETIAQAAHLFAYAAVRERTLRGAA